MAVDLQRERDGLSAESERKCFRPRRTGFSGVSGTVGTGRIVTEGRLSGKEVCAVDEGVLGKCTKTDVYPTVVRSCLKSFTEGVIRLAVVGVSRMFRKDAEGTRPELIEGRRVKERGEMDGRRGLDSEGLRLGVSGAGEPGWTAVTQAVIAEVVADRRRVVTGLQGLAGACRGGDGSG